MTAEEQQMLQGLAERVNRTPAGDKDADAEQYIGQTLGRNPDALYVMAQTILVQGYALEQAQRQMAELRGQLAHAQEPKHGGSFLGNLLGRHDEPRTMTRAAAAPPPPPPMENQYSNAGYGPGLVYPSGGYPIAGGQPASGGFLQSALQTAAGVAAGAFAFEGMERLMHGFGPAAGYGGEFGGGRPEEIINNNYYGDEGSREHRDASYEDRNAGQRTDSGLMDASYRGDDRASNDGETSDQLSGTTDTDYTSQGDDSMLSDDVGDVGDGGGDSGGDSGGGDSSSF